MGTIFKPVMNELNSKDNEAGSRNYKECSWKRVYSVGIGLYFLNLILDKVEIEDLCQFYFIISTDY
jgi:hypothetical protein